MTTNPKSRRSEQTTDNQNGLSKLQYRLQDLIDIEQFQGLQDRLNEIYSFPSAIIDNEGNILTATAWQDVCTKFHRQNKECEKDCIKSDQYILSHLAEANPAVSYRCPHGLVDNATPIVIEGVHYGNFFTGQFFLEEPDLEFFRGQAQKYGFDEEAYLAAVKKVPIWSQKQLENYLFFIKGLIEVISSSGLKKLKEIEQRKQIEENEERASAILGQMLEGFWITSAQDGRIVDVNDAMCQMLGYTRDEMLNLSVADVEAVDMPKDVSQQIRQIMRDGSAHFESRFRRKDGSVIDVEVSVIYLQSTNTFFGFHRDISERMRALTALRHSHELMSYIIEHNRSAVAVHDKDMRYIYVSQRYLDDYKVKEQDVIGKHHYDVFPDLPQKWRDVHQRVLKGEVLSAEDDPYVREDGSVDWTRWECRPWYEADGSIGGLIVYTEVITQRKQAEETLHATKSKLETIINVSPLAIIMLDLEGNVQIWNPAAERILGWSADEVLGKPNPMVPTSKQNEYDRLSAQVLGGAPMISQDIVRQRKDGALIDLNISSAPIYDPVGNLAGRMAIIADISERKRSEEQLQILKKSIDTAPEGAYWMDRDGRFIYANEAGCKALGYTNEELLQMRVFDVNPRATPKRWSQIWEILIERGSSTMESVHRRKDGSEFPVELTSAYLKFGEKEFCNGFAKDITERKQHERELHTIATLSAALRTAATRADMLPVIVEQVVSLLNIDAATIEIIEPQTGDVIIEAAQGVWKDLAGSRQTKGTGANAIITQTLQPFYSRDLEHDPNPFYHTWARHGIRGCAGVPLIAQEKLIGFIWMGKKTDLAENEVELLSAAADIAANAIYRATLHEQTQKDAADLVLAYDTTLDGWARALELRDRETEGHTRRVLKMTLDLARRMGVDDDLIEDIRRGALLHDIGKMGIPDSILGKPGTLNEREWEIMRQHPDYAFNLLNPIEYLRPAINIPYCHHEKWDGSGYPRGLKGEEIPIEARLFAIVDVWDALTSDRPYRLAWSKKNAVKHIREQSGKHFDPSVVEPFLELLDITQIG